MAGIRLSVRHTLLVTLVVGLLAPLEGAAQRAPRTWTHTTQADFMAGERQSLDARVLDALGAPYAYDADPRGAVRLRSRPGPFTRHADNPVFDVGKGDAWDNAVVSEAKVIFDGATYHLWYAARQRLETPQGRKKSAMMTGYATSPDGLHWTRCPDNPVMTPGPLGAPDANHVYPPYVLLDGQQFRMWYSAHDFTDWTINYATSPDGATWEKYPGNPLMREAHDGRWDENFISEPSVLWNGQRFEMWYNGGSERTGTLRVGYAWSEDGLAWSKWQPDEWLLDVGPLGAWDDFSVARVHVLYDGERYQMFYEGHDAASWRLGYAWSDDGQTWRKDADNPIVDLGPPGAFDSVNAAEPYVLFDGQTYRLYYSGYDGDKYRIGLATAPPVYEPEGVLVSAPLDGGRPTYWGELTWTCRLPEGADVQLEVAASDDGRAWSGWQVAAEGSADGENYASLRDLGLPAARYLRYRATLATADPAHSPLLEEVTVAEAAGDFTLAVQPQALTLPAGEAGSYTVSLSPRYGFDEAVSLTMRGLPAGVSARVSDGALTLPVSVTLSLATDLASPAGTHPLTIEAAAASSLTHTVAVSLTLLAATPTPLPTATATPPPSPTPTVAPTATPTPNPSVLIRGSSAIALGVASLALALAAIGFLIRRTGRSHTSEQPPDHSVT